MGPRDFGRTAPIFFFDVYIVFWGVLRGVNKNPGAGFRNPGGGFENPWGGFEKPGGGLYVCTLFVFMCILIHCILFCCFHFVFILF